MVASVPDYAAQYEQMRRLSARLDALEYRAGTLPVVDADPVADGPVRAWVMTDGRLRWYDSAGTVHQAAETTPGPATSTPALPNFDSAPETRQVTVDASWVVSFGAGSPPPGAYGDGVRVMIGFGDLSAELAGAVSVVAVEVWLYNLGAVAERVPVGVGVHYAAAAPSAYEGQAPVSRVDLPRVGSSGWARISRDLGWQFVDGGARGLVVDQAATSELAGRLAVEAPRAPRIRLTVRA